MAIFFVLILILVGVLNNIPPGYIFCAGDFIQYFNFDTIIPEFKYAWLGGGIGFFSPIFLYAPYYYIFGFIQKVVGIDYIFSFYLIFFLLSSFFSFKFSAKIIFCTNRRFILNAISFIYALNAYTFAKFINPSPFLFLYVLVPLIFALAYKHFLSDKLFGRQLAILGLIIFLSNISFGNAAYFTSLNILLVVFVFLIWLFNIKTIGFILFLKKIFVFYILFFLVSLVSIVPQISGLINMSKSFSDGNNPWSLNEWIYWQALKLKDLLFFTEDISMSVEVYSSTILLTGLSLFVFFVLALAKKYNSQGRKVVLVFSLLTFFDIFLINKGKDFWTKDIVTQIFGSSPILASIRSTDKTLIFLPFFVLIIIFVFLVSMKNKKITYFASLIFLMITTLPLYFVFQGKLLTHYAGIDIGKDYKTSQYSYIVKIPQEYYDLSDRLKSQKFDSRIFSVPYNVINSIGWNNFPKWKAVGGDLTVQLFNQSVVQMVSPQFGVWNYGKFWNGQDSENSKWLLPFASLLNMEYIIYHKDVADQFIDQTIDKINYYEKNNLIEKIEENDYFSFYKINTPLLSHFYVPQFIIFTGRSIEDLPKILSVDNLPFRPAVFLIGQNIGKETELAKLQNMNQGESVVSPMLEFKKINPTKYRMRVHGATGAFPLVFSESFNDGWKIYLNQGLDSRLHGNDNLKKYKILDGNDEDQATQEELQDYIQEGYITDLGNNKEKTIQHKKWENNEEKPDYTEKYNIDFISKNFNGTIQNDNLPQGKIWETWFKKPIENNENHLIANGYANSWVVDPQEICENATSLQPSPDQGEGTSGCIKNPDGTYDFEIVVEFWPQRLFYLGLFVSGMTFLGCVVFLGYDWRRRRKIFGAK